MFRKKCKNCGKEIKKDFRFCPTCGTNLKKKNLGMFGEDDFENSATPGGFPGGFNMILNSLVKNFEKQFRELERASKQEKPKTKKSGISISIATVPGKEPKIKVNSLGNSKIGKAKTEEVAKKVKLPSNVIKTGKLPKKEPSTNIRRLSDKIIYEIKIPGVKSLKDISIIQLEGSIEVRAKAKDKAYIKLIPMKLPIRDYELEKGKLILELDGASD